MRSSRGCKSIERDIEAGNFVFDESLEDIHMVIEAALIERIGEPGRKLHTGRSRNDQVALDLFLWLKDEAAPEIDASCSTSLPGAACDLAERSGDIVMPSYTHLQRAQPILAGAEALAWCTHVRRRPSARIASTIDLAKSQSPLGSGAIAGSSLPIDPDVTRQAARLRRVRRGAASPRQPRAIMPLAFVFALSMVAMHLSRWAEQWIIYSSTEFSFIKIADRYTTGSSMMPQKRNPDMLELIRGRCGTVYGNLFALLTICKGLPIGYNRDLQEDKRHVFQAYDTVQACLTMAAAIVSSASFVRENIEPTLERGFLDATSLAEYFVTKGVAFRTAHQIVGSLVARCEREGKESLSQLSVADFVEAAQGAERSGRTDRCGCLRCAGGEECREHATEARARRAGSLITSSLRSGNAAGKREAPSLTRPSLRPPGGIHAYAAGTLRRPPVKVIDSGFRRWTGSRDRIPR